MASPLSDYFKFSILGGKGQGAGGILTGGRGGYSSVPSQRGTLTRPPGDLALQPGVGIPQKYNTFLSGRRK